MVEEIQRVAEGHGVSLPVASKPAEKSKSTDYPCCPLDAGENTVRDDEGHPPRVSQWIGRSESSP